MLNTCPMLHWEVDQPLSVLYGYIIYIYALIHMYHALLLTYVYNQSVFYIPYATYKLAVQFMAIWFLLWTSAALQVPKLTLLFPYWNPRENSHTGKLINKQCHQGFLMLNFPESFIMRMNLFTYTVLRKNIIGSYFPSKVLFSGD